MHNLFQSFLSVALLLKILLKSDASVAFSFMVLQMLHSHRKEQQKIRVSQSSCCFVVPDPDVFCFVRSLVETM